MPYHNAYAAKIDESRTVRNVVVIPHMGDDDEQITRYCNEIGLDGRWLDCSFLGSRRGRFPSIGDLYDEANDCFVERVIDNAVTPERLEELANAGFQE